jgi:hypothetical protein
VAATTSPLLEPSTEDGAWHRGYAGDAERMERSLHDDLVKRTPLREDDLIAEPVIARGAGS